MVDESLHHINWESIWIERKDLAQVHVINISPKILLELVILKLE